MSSSYRSKFRSIEIVSGPALVPTIGWTLLAAFAQATLAPYLTIHGVVPSLVTIAIVLYTVRAGVRRGALLAIIGGVAEDAFGGTGGAWTIASTTLALAIGAISRRFFSDGFPMLGALVALSVALRCAVFWAVMELQGYPRGLAAMHAHAALWQALVTGAVTVAYLIARSRLIVDRTNVERYP